MHAPSQPLRSSLWPGFLGLIRWPNLLIIAGTQLLAFFVFVQSEWRSAHSGEYIFLSCVLLLTLAAAAAGYIMNDMMDRVADLENNRSNPLNTGGISVRAALLSCYLLIAVGMACAAMLVRWSVHFLWIYPGIILVLWAYSKYFKRMVLLGNIAVSCFCAGVIFLLWSPALPLLEIPRALWMFILFAFLTTLIREIVKDMEDYKGDLKVGDRTLPVALGMGTARYAALLFFLATLSLLILFATPPKEELLKFILWLLTAGLLIATMIYFMIKAREQKQLHTVSTLLKVCMMTGILFLVS